MKVTKKTLHLALLLSAVLGLVRCTKPDVPQDSDTLIVCVGGLGDSQMGSVIARLEEKFPKCQVCSAGSWDAYKADLVKMVGTTKHRQVIFIGHSFGCQAICDSAFRISNCSLAILIDPIAVDWGNLSAAGLKKTIVYVRGTGGVPPIATVFNATELHVVSRKSHNEMPHCPDVLDGVVEYVNQLM